MAVTIALLFLCAKPIYSICLYQNNIGRVVTMAQSIGANIKAMRRSLGLNQEDLAEKLGLTQANISRI